jgi:DNA repair exonuclease SbcCD nuclease subunit
MSKIAFITDTHFGARNDSPLFVEYFLSFLEGQFFPYLKANNIKTVIHLGDLMDRRKYVNFYVLSQVKSKFMDYLRKNNIDFHCIVGNHDTFFKNTNDLNSINELFGENGIYIYDKPMCKTIEGFDFAIVPWINKENEKECLDFIKTARASVCLGHFELYGYEIMRGIPHEDGMDPDLLARYEMVLSGHFHVKHSKDNVHYLGTPYQITFNDLGQKKGFYIFDTETRNLEFIENERKLFYTLTYNDVDFDMLSLDFERYRNCFIRVYIQKKKSQKLFDQYLEKLNSVEVSELNIIDMPTQTTEENVDIDTTKDTLTIISDEIDRMEEVPNKNKLKTIIHNLYLESLSQ